MEPKLARPKPQGAVVTPYWPQPGAVWTLRDVLPRLGETYEATIERVWRDDAGRLLARFAGQNSQQTILEVWVSQGRKWEHELEPPAAEEP